MPIDNLLTLASTGTDELIFQAANSVFAQGRFVGTSARSHRVTIIQTIQIRGMVRIV